MVRKIQILSWVFLFLIRTPLFAAESVNANSESCIHIASGFFSSFFAGALYELELPSVDYRWDDRFPDSPQKLSQLIDRETLISSDQRGVSTILSPTYIKGREDQDFTYDLQGALKVRTALTETIIDYEMTNTHYFWNSSEVPSEEKLMVIDLVHPVTQERYQLMGKIDHCESSPLFHGFLLKHQTSPSWLRPSRIIVQYFEFFARNEVSSEVRLDYLIKTKILQ